MGLMNHIVAIVPIGKIDPHILSRLYEEIKVVFHSECRLDEPLPLPETALVHSRNQYVAGAILERLGAGSAEHILGVVDRDLFAPGLNFVFGQADLSNERAVIALPRLRNSFYGKEEDAALFLERTVKEAVHELGHTHGLPHCNDRRCVMTFSNSLPDTDFKNKTFCSQCVRKLGL